MANPLYENLGFYKPGALKTSPKTNAKQRRRQRQRQRRRELQKYRAALLFNEMTYNDKR